MYVYKWYHATNRYSFQPAKIITSTFVSDLPCSNGITMATQEKTTQQHSYITRWPSPHRNALLGPEINSTAGNSSLSLSLCYTCQELIQFLNLTKQTSTLLIMNPSTVFSFKVGSNLIFSANSFHLHLVSASVVF